MEYSYGEKILSIQNVNLAFGDRVLLKDINLDIQDVKRPDKVAGQIIGLLGPSGRGKTQLFNVIAGLRAPTSGTILYKGQPVKKGQIGVVAQDYPLLIHRTALENLTIVAMNVGLSKAEAKQKSEFYLERFKMVDKAGFYPKELSGGQRQRIAIAQQMLCSERFLLMDEPFSGLDVNMIGEVSEVILEVANMHEDNTIIVVSHDYQSTAAIADELCFLGFEEDGQGGQTDSSTIRYRDNLIEKGFAWNYPNVFTNPDFGKYLLDIRNIFSKL